MWHKLTPLFAKTAFDRIAIIQNHWNHYSLIQQIEKGNFTPPVLKNVSPISNYYLHFPSDSTNKIDKIFEYNCPTYFYPLTQKGVNVHTYKKGEHLDTASQPVPDNVFDFRNSQYQDKRVHGMDHKAYENPRELDSKIFSNISKKKYMDGLDDLESLIRSNIIDITKTQLNNIQTALTNLKYSCDNINEHQLIWAQNVHYFPKEFIPPMRVPNNFSTQDLRQEFKEHLEFSQERMQKISNYLYAQKVPENDLKKALEYLNDSFIQKLLETN